MDALTFDDLPDETTPVKPAAPANQEGAKWDPYAFQDLDAQAGVDQQKDSAQQYDPNGLDFGDLPSASSFDVAKEGLVRGVRDAYSGVQQTRGFLDKSLKGRVEAGEETSAQPGAKTDADLWLQTPIGQGWKHADWWIAQLTHGTAASSPMLAGATAGGITGGFAAGPAGAVAGGVAGGGLGAALQTLGPAYVKAREQGLNHDQAVDRAMVETGIAAAFGGAQAAAPAVGVFGRTAEGALKKPISEALFQIFGAQPGLGVAQHVATNAATGQELPNAEELAQDYATNAATGAVLSAAHAAARRPRVQVEFVPDGAPDAAQSSALVTDAGAPAAEASPTPAFNPDAIRDLIRRNRPAVETVQENAPDAAQAAALQPAQPAPQAPTSQVPADIAVKAREIPTRDEALADMSGKLDDTGQNVQEAPATIEAQQEQLTTAPKGKTDPVPDLRAEQGKVLNGERKAVMYPEGTLIPSAPDGPRFKRVRTARGTFDYDSTKITAKQIRELSAQGKENEILGLGPVDKQEVAARVEQGEAPVAVTERTPEGTEVKAAVGTEQTAPVQAEALEQGKTPGNTVAVEAPAPVIGDREQAAPPAGPRILRNVKELEAEKAEDAKLAAGHRGKDDGVAPDGSRAARDRFIRRAQAAVTAQGNDAPEHYRQAVELAGQRSKGRSAKNEQLTQQIDAQWQKEYEAEQQGISRARVRGSVVKDEELNADDVAPSENLTAKPEAAVTDQDRARFLQAFPGMRGRDQADIDSMIRLTAAQKRSQATRGASDGEQRQSGFAVDENNVVRGDGAAGEIVTDGSPTSSRMGYRSGAGIEPGAAASEVRRPKLSDAEKAALVQRMKALESGARLHRDAEGGADLAELHRLAEELRESGVAPESYLAVETRNYSDVLRSIDPKEFINAGRFSEVENGILRANLVTIAQKVRAHISDVPVHVLRDVDFNNLTGRPRSFGYYDPMTHTITLPERTLSGNKSELTHTILHEGTHAAFFDAMRRNDAIRSDVLEIARAALRESDRTKNSEKYAFTGVEDGNVQEFVAEAFSNPRFQAFLSTAKAPEHLVDQLGLRAAKPATVWDMFRFKVSQALRGLKEALGFSRADKSLFDAIMHVSEGADQHVKEVGARGERDPFRELMGDQLHHERNDPFHDELARRGVPDDQAEAIAKILREELGDKADVKSASSLLDQLGQQYGSKAGASNTSAGNSSSGNASKPKMSLPAKKPASPAAPASPSGVGPKGRSILAKIKARVGEDRVEKVREELMDFNRPVERTQERVEERTGPLSENERFYDKKRLLEARTSERLRQLDHGPVREIEKLTRDAQAAGVDFKTLGEWLIARHAEERNQHIAAQDPNTVSGSGMSTADARRTLNDIAADPKKQALFDRAVKLNDDLREIELNAKVDSGLLSKKTANEFREKFKTYTSLRGFEDPEITARIAGEKDMSLVGHEQVSVFGNNIRTAEGRESQANNPLVNMVNQARMAISAAERNRVILTAGKAMEKAGFTADDAAHVTGNIRDTPVARNREGILDPRVVGYMDDGKQKYMVFRDKDLANAFVKMSPDKLPRFIQFLTDTTNKVKSLWTHFSPEFVIRHFVFRYPIEAMMNLRSLSEQGVKSGAVGYLKDAFGSIADVKRYLDGNAPKDPRIAGYMKEMAEAGGIVSYKHMSDTFKLKEYMTDLAANDAKSKALFSRIKGLGDGIDHVLTAADTSERLAVYMRSREAGMSPQKAALAARDATVDFGRKGNASGVVSIWIEFGNVALQTTSRMLRAAKSPAFRRTLAGVMGAAAALEYLNYTWAGNDEDGTPMIEKVPSYERTQNIFLMTPYKNGAGKNITLKIPLPYPLFAFWAAGSAITQTAMSIAGKGKLTPGDIVGRVAHGAAETFTPIGSHVNNMLTLVTPALFRPLTEIGQNRDWTNRPIHPENKFAKKNEPHSEQSFPSTGEGYQTAARLLSKIGLDVYPDDIKHLANHFIGAQMRIFNNADKAVDAAGNGVFDPGKVPGLRVVMGANDQDAADRNRYYNITQKAELTKGEADALRKDQNGEVITSREDADLASARRVVKRSGMTADQVLEVNKIANAEKNRARNYKRQGNKAGDDPSMMKDVNKEQAGDQIKKALSRFNELGIQGGVDKH